MDKMNIFSMLFLQSRVTFSSVLLLIVRSQWELRQMFSTFQYELLHLALCLSSRQTITPWSVFKRLGKNITKDEILEVAILDRYRRGRKTISMLNGVLWDRTVNNAKKRGMYDTIVKSIIVQSSEVWTLKENIEKRLKVTEMTLHYGRNTYETIDMVDGCGYVPKISNHRTAKRY